MSVIYEGPLISYRHLKFDSHPTSFILAINAVIYPAGFVSTNDFSLKSDILLSKNYTAGEYS